eukprot:CAMPEP_0197245796 /NCGR_PEP_ID=MMETSP1429-20130617/10469_1 /TAXON_ID=49237 /ORGANISM="Chaetoceros  sp., Strain UNC1202" /LENGTH=51 /DNA_ID=CAMNT_0042706353 /DNA_START=171 /DNA_END=326 /DNA_ORIENTATION=-
MTEILTNSIVVSKSQLFGSDAASMKGNNPVSSSLIDNAVTSMRMIASRPQE